MELFFAFCLVFWLAALVLDADDLIPSISDNGLSREGRLVVYKYTLAGCFLVKFSNDGPFV